MTTIPIFPTCPYLYKKATQLAATFHLEIVDTPQPTLPFLLYLTEERLELHDMQTKMGPVYVDFVEGVLGHRRCYGGGRKQPLAKAIGLKHGATPLVLDATAGLGRDAFILAFLGCHVQMVERSPVIAVLLHDGLQRAQQDVEVGSFIKKRLQLIHHNAQHWIEQSTPLKPDVIYLDPMYPHRQKSALVKKEMRIFRKIVGDDLDAPTLLKKALGCANQRVVVKRPFSAPTLDDSKPSFCIKSKNTRFDVYKMS